MAANEIQGVPTGVVAEARKFLQDREGAESENRQEFANDLRFAYVPGEQWDANARMKRQGRPCYTYNRVAGAINQLVGDQRMMHPSGKVRAMNKQAATTTADILGGLIRDIWAQSDADKITNEAFKYAVAGSWGCWRIVPEYADDESFDQVLRIKRIANPLTVYFDEGADPFGCNSRRCMIAERISRDEYEADYGDGYVNVPASHDSKGWFDKDTVRIAEYYRLDYRKKRIVELSDGRVLEYTRGMQADFERMRKAGMGAPEIVREREARSPYVTWWKVDGARILEGPIEYDYSYIPVVRLPGRFINIEGKQYYESLIRHGKDAARTYNYDRSSMVETVALTPRAPWVVTAKMIKGYEEQWSRANVSNAPYLMYDVDPDAPEARPQRTGGPEVPQAYIALAAHDAEDIKQTIGYINPAVEQQTQAGDAESGRALRTRLMTGDSGSYEFLDHFGKAVETTWRILIDMIPVHYDTERVVRILGMDGRESFEELSPEALKQGKYDVTVTLGPAYATQRMESLDMLLEASTRMPVIMEEAPDIVVRNLDVEGADEIEQRIRLRLIQAGKIPAAERDQRALEELPEQQPDPVQTALAGRLEAQGEKDLAAAMKAKVETAGKMAEAASAERRENLELERLVKEIAHQQAETIALLRGVVSPRGPNG